MKPVVEWVLSHPEAVVAAVVAVFSMLKGSGWLAEQFANQRWQRIRAFALLAFHAVEEAAKLEPSMTGLAKALLFVEKIDAQLEGAGDAPLSPAEKEVAKTILSPALHAASKAEGPHSPPPLAPPQ